MEQLLQEIWKNILELEQMPGVDESFFDLGGNSFSAAQVITELEERTGSTAEVADFYENETIAAFVTLLQEKKEGAL